MKCERNLSRKKIKNMNSEIATNSQLSVNEPKRNKRKKNNENKN